MKNLSLLLSLTLPLTLRAEPLANPGFEEGDQGWNISEKIPISSVVADAAHEGQQGLRISDESTEGSANIQSSRIPVESGQTVTLTFWARSNTETLAAVNLIPFTANNRPLSDDNGKFPAVYLKKGSGDWTFYEHQYVVPDEVTSIGLSIRSWTKSTGVADLDDFSLKVE